MIRLLQILAMIGFLIIPLSSLAHGYYSSETLYTISWGNEPGKISSDFRMIGEIGDHEIFEPGPWAVSDSSVLVIIEENQDGIFIMKFDSNGDFIVRNELAFEAGIPRRIAILSGGAIAITGSKVPQAIVLLDSNLNILHEITLTYSDYGLYDLTTSNQNSF